MFYDIKRGKKTNGKKKANIKSISFLILIILISLYLVYFYFCNKFGYHNESTNTWVSQEIVNISKKIIDKFSLVTIKNREISFDVNGQNITIFIREPVTILTSQLTVLLLHGAGSSSNIWVEVKTLNLLSTMGLRAVAIDLPGWANSKHSILKKKEDASVRSRFIQNLILKLNLGRPVIISPSMAGHFSISYMMLPDPESCHKRLLAFIPIATVDTQTFSHAQYHRCEIPVMIVQGTNDTGLGLTSLGNLRNMPNMELREMVNAGHACYIERPMEWNTLLYNFIRNLQHKLGEIVLN